MDYDDDGGQNAKTVRTAPVKGAPRHPCTPHKYADQESLLWYLLVNCGVRLGSRDLKIHFILYYIKYKFLLFCWKWSKNHRVLDITGNDDKNTRNTMVILLFNVVWNRDATIYGLLTYMRNTFQSSVWYRHRFWHRHCVFWFWRLYHGRYWWWTGLCKRG